MINGMTPQQYATVVANLCDKVLSMRSLDYHERRGLPVTQSVICSLSQPYRTSMTDRNVIDISEKALIFKSRFERWDGESFLSFQSKWYEFHADLTGECDIRESVYNAVLKRASELDTIPDCEMKIDPESHPVLMFITRIRCGDHENPDTIRRAYIGMMKSKYSLDIPNELIQVSPDILDYDLDTAVKFVSGKSRILLPKDMLKRT